MKVRLLVQLLVIFLPWSIRRRLLNLLPGVNIANTAYIGKSLILSSRLEMKAFSRIGSLTLCKPIDLLRMGTYGRIGTLNYITGYPTSGNEFFTHKTDRKCQLIVGKHSAITSRHFIDCTDEIYIGNYTTIAGVRSQLFTHSINLKENIQDCKPIKIGSYNFIGTNVVILPGAQLPDYCVLGANSLLQKRQLESFALYGGVPAEKIKPLSLDTIKYFNRKSGFVD